MKTTKTTRPISPTVRGNRALTGPARHPLPATGYRLPTTGFTLMELLIAIGILAVGGAMAAALFPAAIKENQRANSSVIGRVINENALSTLKAELSLTPGPYFTTGGGLLVPYTSLGRADIVYPTPYFLAPPNPPIPTDPDADDPDWINDGGTVVPKSLYGFLVLGRQIGVGASYQLVFVAYRRYAITSTTDPNDITTEVTFTSTPGSTNFEIETIETGGRVQLGSPLIHRGTGRFATIMSYNPDTHIGTLDRPIYPQSITEPTIHNGYVIQDSDVAATRSPAIRLMIWSGSL